VTAAVNVVELIEGYRDARLAGASAEDLAPRPSDPKPPTPMGPPVGADQRTGRFIFARPEDQVIGYALEDIPKGACGVIILGEHS
jgi:hypothetical protein